MGLVGVFCGTLLLLHNEKEIFDFYDDPQKYYDKRDSLIEKYTVRVHKLMTLPDSPDFICTGGSGSLVFQSSEIFRELALPIVKHVTAMCKTHGIPSHIHSCGRDTPLENLHAMIETARIYGKY